MNRSTGGFTPVPDSVFDVWLPLLKDTEVRLLLVVLRSTLGWGKERDWLSHSHLCLRTGRSSDAVSSALALLIGQGLVVAETISGETLATPASRRRYLGRIYLKPGPALD